MRIKKHSFKFFLLIILMFLMLVMTSSCTLEAPHRISVEKENPPRFTFSKGEDLGLLYVYHVSKKLYDEGVPGKNISPYNPDMVWWIEGKRRVNESIIYGVVPIDMREITPAQPLIEGERYLVSGNHGGDGGTNGKIFLIRNGIPTEP